MHRRLATQLLLWRRSRSSGGRCRPFQELARCASLGRFLLLWRYVLYLVLTLNEKMAASRSLSCQAPLMVSFAREPGHYRGVNPKPKYSTSAQLHCTRPTSHMHARHARASTLRVYRPFSP